jgi:hypothetical protein
VSSREGLASAQSDKSEKFAIDFEAMTSILTGWFNYDQKL